MKTIPLTRGQVALVDDADFEWLSQWKWCAYPRKQRETKYDAVRKIRANDKPKAILMHRLILNAPEGMEVDHIDGNPLDNQRHNLRLATDAQNSRNAGKRKRGGISSSEYKGVYWEQQRGKWKAQIRVNNKQVYLGYFTDELEAAYAYDDAACELHGTFAWLNFPERQGSGNG